MPQARRLQRVAKSSTRQRITPGTVTATINGKTVALSGSISTTESITFDGLNISIARDTTGYPWVASVALSNNQTVNNATYNLTGTSGTLADGSYVAYVSYSLDGQNSWTTGPKVKFTIGTPPTPVLPNEPEVKVLSATPASVGVMWAAPTQPGGSILGYQVTVKGPNGQALSGYPKQIEDPQTRSYVAEGLSPATNYTFEVLAINSAGYGPFTAISQVTTSTTGGGSGRPNAPVITITGSTTSTIDVSWTAPTQPNGALTNYRIGWDAPGGQPVASWSDLYPTSTTSLNLTNLAIDSIYSIWVEAINANGTGERYTVIQRTNASGGGGGNPGDGSPGAEVGIYFKIWNDDPLPSQINATNVRLSFAIGGSGAMRLSGYTSAGRTAFIQRLNEWRGQGRKIILSLGGAHDSIDMPNPWLRAQQTKAIADDIGGLDGIDFDFESEDHMPSLQAHIAYAQGCKSLFGDDFRISVAPGGNAIDAYYRYAPSLHAAGVLDEFAQQYYDWKGYTSITPVVGRIRQAMNLGIPASKLGLGFRLGNPPVHRSMQECIDWLSYCRSTFGVNKTYLWIQNWNNEASQTRQWEKRMCEVVGLPYTNY